MLAAALALGAPAAQAQCASPAAAPRLLLERFISADCAQCWAQPPLAPSPGSGALVLDWIVPGERGDDAPLAAAATPEAAARQAGLGHRNAHGGSDVHVTDLPARPLGRLRVGQGPPVADYLGTTAYFTPPAHPAGPYRLSVALVESIAAGAEGTPVARQLVRGAFDTTWAAPAAAAAGKGRHWMELRPMRIPEGEQPERLRVLAWVQDGAGRLVAAAQSRCE